MWSGSEELWVRSAKQFCAQNYTVSFVTKFEHPELLKIKGHFFKMPFDYPARSLFRRIFDRVRGYIPSPQNALKSFVLKHNPNLIIISQGNNFESLKEMQLCNELGIPFLTITQLVTEFQFLAFNQNNLPLLRDLYSKALKNYFVSKHNLLLNNFMLGLDLLNAELVFNPCKVTNTNPPAFPSIDGLYNIALVGRIECLHKGYDILCHVVSSEKWRSRSVRFNLYGEGPHLELIKANCQRMNIECIVLRGHAHSIPDVWKENQLLLMPSRMEGQALSLIEAMWCNRAAIVTDVGGAIELVEEGYSGFIAEAPTVSSLDAALEKAWEQRERWEEFGKNAGTSIREKYPEDAGAYLNSKIKALFE
jgi:glycosyltransferase involved in cell wall biosynthesis